MVGVATYNRSAPSSRIATLSAIAEAIITLPDGRQIMLDEGWKVEAGGRVNENGELREVALVREGIRLTFAVRMVKARLVRRVKASARTIPRRYRAAIARLNTGLKPARTCSDEAISCSNGPGY
jgi:hypothetical protein